MAADIVLHANLSIKTSILMLLQEDVGDKKTTYVLRSFVVWITYKPTHTCHGEVELAGGCDS